MATLQTQVDAQNQVVRKLEEKERILQNNLSTMDKEISLRQQSLELNKRKVALNIASQFYSFYLIWGWTEKTWLVWDLNQQPSD